MPPAFESLKAAALAGVVGVLGGVLYMFFRVFLPPIGTDIASAAIGAVFVGAFAAIFVFPAMAVLGWPIAAACLHYRIGGIPRIALIVAAATVALLLVAFLLGFDPYSTRSSPGQIGEPFTLLLRVSLPFAISTIGALAWAIDRSEQRLAAPVSKSPHDASPTFDA